MRIWENGTDRDYPVTISIGVAFLTPHEGHAQQEKSLKQAVEETTLRATTALTLAQRRNIADSTLFSIAAQEETDYRVSPKPLLGTNIYTFPTNTPITNG